ncbi:MAG: GNAT family N-acetyltransferase [Pseudomonadota bacterium]
MTLEVGPTTDLVACLELRRVVFMIEQNVSEADERDGKDDVAHHILAQDNGVPLGCARILVDGSTGKIGRVCVLKDHRGTGLGQALVDACLAHLSTIPNVTRAALGAQTNALGFYEKLGFVAFGPEFLDANIPHRMMERAL